jgi:uncharacterized protein YggE
MTRTSDRPQHQSGQPPAFEKPRVNKSFLLLFFKKEVLLLLFLPLSAHAQTTLNLSATGQVMVTPDQIAASLTAQDNSYNAATAQNAVNAAMAAGLKLARALAGVKAVTESESVSPVTPDGATGRVQYQASQQLDLTMPAQAGAPPPAFSALLGTLQNRGFLLQNYDGELSDQAQEAGEQAAIADAIRQIKEQARAVAAALGESFGRVETVNLNMPEGGPGPVAFAAAAPGPMMARAFVAPSAAPANVQVSASVTAVVDLAAAH